MTRIFQYTLALAGAALLSLTGSTAWAGEPQEGLRAPSVDQELVDAGFFEATTAAAVSCCVPDGSVDDTLGMWSCCSGYAVTGSTVCTRAADYGSTWTSCRHVCGTAPVGGCIPSGGWDDTLSINRCCSGSAVPGSTWCLDPADYGTDWKSCVQKCQ
jgi:hypothetical protein